MSLPLGHCFYRHSCSAGMFPEAYKRMSMLECFFFFFCTCVRKFSTCVTRTRSNAQLKQCFSGITSKISARWPKPTDINTCSVLSQNNDINLCACDNFRFYLRFYATAGGHLSDFFFVYNGQVIYLNKISRLVYL